MTRWRQWLAMTSRGPAWGRARAMVVAAGERRRADRGGGSRRRAAKRIDETGGGTGDRKEKSSGRVGRQADGRVEEASGRQGVATGLMEELGGLECLGESGGLACRVGTTTACQGWLRRSIRIRVIPNPKQ